MVVGVCRLVLAVPGAPSVRDKRQRLRPMLQLVRKEYELSAAEVGDQDQAERSVIGLALVGTDRRTVGAVLEKLVNRIAELGDPLVLGQDIEITSYGQG